VRELLGILRAGRATKAKNLEEDLPKAFRVGLAEILERIEDGL
jgi:hypothetical protein